MMTDQAHARLALRRLAVSLLNVRTIGPLSHPDDPERPALTTDEVLAQLDEDEGRDFAIVFDALTEVPLGDGPPRFILVRGFDEPTGPGPLYVVDTRPAAPDPFGVREARVLGQAAGVESGRVAVRHLNARPDLYDDAREAELSDAEPF